MRYHGTLRRRAGVREAIPAAVLQYVPWSCLCHLPDLVAVAGTSFGQLTQAHKLHCLASVAGDVGQMPPRCCHALNPPPVRFATYMQLNIPEAKFEGQFGISWKQALADGAVACGVAPLCVYAALAGPAAARNLPACCVPFNAASSSPSSDLCSCPCGSVARA